MIKLQFSQFKDQTTDYKFKYLDGLDHVLTLGLLERLLVQASAAKRNLRVTVNICIQTF